MESKNMKNRFEYGIRLSFKKFKKEYKKCQNSQNNQVYIYNYVLQKKFMKFNSR